jgi:hypothetical protein
VNVTIGFPVVRTFNLRSITNYNYAGYSQFIHRKYTGTNFTAGLPLGINYFPSPNGLWSQTSRVRQGTGYWEYRGKRPVT